MLDSIPFYSITEEHLQNLIDASVPEGRRIEYKQQIHKDGSDGNKEFQQDVSAFANTEGGYIIFGIAAKSGVPTGFTPITEPDCDSVKQRFNNTLEALRPRLLINIHEVRLSSGGYALVLKIPNSENKPHAVAKETSFRIYGRNDAGKHDMDWGQVKMTFLRALEDSKRFEQFRTERIEALQSRQSYVAYSPNYDGRFITMHIVPSVGITPQVPFVPVGFVNKRPTGEYQSRYLPPSASYCDYSPNYDGYLCDGKSSFLSFHRDGKIEAVCIGRYFLSHVSQLEDLGDRVRNGYPLIQGLIYTNDIEGGFIEGLRNYMALLQESGAAAPLVVLLTFHNVRGFCVYPERLHSLQYARPIDRDQLLLPPVVVDSYDSDPALVLKPCFDLIWAACGFEKSAHYNNGAWHRIENRAF